MQGDWKDSIGLDSIQLMELSAQLNSFFQLYEKPQAPYLLSMASIEEWVEAVFKTIGQEESSLSFQSSGTSGQTKITRHSMLFLDREISFLKDLFSDSTYIIPYIPSYSIYGFLFTIGLPAALNLPLVYPSDCQWQEAKPGSLIIATPFHWKNLVTELPDHLNSVYGVSSGAPLFDSLYEMVQQKGIQLTDIFGASESAGIGFRKNRKDAFSLFPYWSVKDEEKRYSLQDKDSGRFYPLMDEIQWENDNGFRVLGRKDKQINIAGILVDLDGVSSAIKQLANVRFCTVSAKAIQGEVKLEAAIQLISDTEQERRQIIQEIRSLLPAQERPGCIDFLL